MLRCDRHARRPRGATAAKRAALLAIVTGALAACSPPARWYAVAGEVDGTVITLDGLGVPVDTFQVATDPAAALHVRYGRDGTSLVVLTSAAPPSLLRMQRDGGRVLASYGLAAPGRDFLLDRKGRRAFVARGNVVEVIWLADGTRSRVLETCGAETVALVPFHAADRLFAICRDGIIAEIDTRLETVLRASPPREDRGGDCRARGGALSGSGALLLVACDAPSRLLFIDRVTLAVLRAMDLDGPAGPVIASGARGVMLSGDMLLLLDLRVGTVASRLPLPGQAHAMTATADGQLTVLVGDERTSTVIRVDAATGAIHPLTTFDRPMRTVAAWPEATPVFNW